MGDPVVIEAALNGERSRREHPAVPCTPDEVAAEAHACAVAGASVVHIHARDMDGAWSAAPKWYAEALPRIRERTPDLLISITSLRPATVAASVVLDALTVLAADARTRPDLISVNLGHIVAWETSSGTRHGRRRTAHFPNDYEDIAALLTLCRELGVTPELGVMDLGFVSNAVTLRDDGLLPPRPWFLVELDSAAYGAGRQVAPSTPANYDALSAALREHFPTAAWAGHGVEQAGYAVLRRALHGGAHIRVGFEDAIDLADGRRASGNAELVTWAAAAAREGGREPATAVQAAAIIGCLPPH